MAKSHFYRVVTTWTGAAGGPTETHQLYSREWSAQIAGKPTITGSADAAFRGDPALHNPEDLLLIALSTCHMLSYLALCARNRIAVVSYVDEASATMSLDSGKTRFTEALLRPRIAIAPGADGELAIRLHEAAHEGCFIASSVNFPVRCEPVVNVSSSN